ncbi:MAG: hypothetical protein GXY42_06850 [Desulfovibrionales bacterium]|nr:hypothetical protein [Desulfovibrionales bacterium]
MRTLRFYKVFPGGNPTILVLDPVDPLERSAVAQAFMAGGHLQAEQVGFLDLGAHPVRLDMMGGEFCGNACRSAAAVMATEGAGLFREGAGWAGELSASGARRPLRVRAVPAGETWECWAEMPLLDADDPVSDLGPGLGLIRLPGIVHLCLDETRHPFPADVVRETAQLRRRFGLDGEAVGCIWYAPHAAGCAIKPVVWVRSTASTCFETGCGSGSLAVALWLGRGQNLPMPAHVVQPSGREIGVQIDRRAQGVQAWIFGPVALVARGEAWV